MPTYFTIGSALNGLVLDINGHNIDAGTSVITYSNNEADNQLWYHDVYSGAIRTKANHDFVLDISDGNLVINPFDPYSETQKFDCEGDHIYQRGDHGKVLDVANSDESEAARVCLWDHNGGANQCWTINRQEPSYFLIRSALNGLVLDISDGSSDAGAAVITWDESGNDNQLWYEDQHGLITSKLNDFVLDAESDEVTMSPFNRYTDKQGFAFVDDRIVNLNSPDDCLDIKGGDSDSGSKMCMWGYKGTDNQHWSREYV